MIRDDDPSAVFLLTAKLDHLTAERDRCAAYNRTCRKGTPDRSLLDIRQVAYLDGCLRHTRYNCPGERMPAYVSANLSGRIGEIRKRIERLNHAASPLS
jgi:G:T-mismatch repair DNA endonuclease (very short patch repair protein)